MPLYSIYRQVIESNAELPELVRAAGVPPDVRFQLFPSRHSTNGPVQWNTHWRLPDGREWLLWAREGSRYRLRFPSLADFEMTANGREVLCYPSHDVPESTVRHLFLDQVLPLALSHRGKLVLHASAVANQEGAIAFAGVSGTGKSTLGTSFCRQGFSLLADDGLVLEEDERGLLAVPGYPGVRLWEDTVSWLLGEGRQLPPVAHYTEKVRVGTADTQFHFCSEPALLRRVYLLSEPASTRRDDDVAIHPLPAQEGFMELVRHSYRLDLQDPERLRDEFVRLARVIAAPLFYRLEFPRKLELLPQVRAAILRDLESSKAGR